MIFALLLLQVTAPAGTATPRAPDAEARFERCADLATGDPAQGAQEATAWRLAGGGFLAQQCLGLAYTSNRNFAAAADAFAQAAREAEVAKDGRAANYWAQSGNAWLAADEPEEARPALDAAIASGRLTALALGEAHLDRARAIVASGDPLAARADLDAAIANAPDDPLAWLLSATHARRLEDLPRAQKDIAEALRRSPDDAAVQLEAGNIAAKAGDEAAAKAAWTKATTLAPDSPSAKAAQGAMAQFSAGK